MNSLVTRSRTASATSSGVPSRWSGMRTARLWALASGVIFSWNRVRMMPGATQLTRMLSSATSRASEPRELQDRAFDGGVGDRAGHAADAGDARDEDDRAVAVGPHQGQGGAAEIIGGVDVDVERRVPLLGRTLVDRSPGWAAGGVDENVEAVERVGSFVHGAVGFLRPSDVGDDDDALAAGGGDGPLGFGGVGIVVAAVDGDVAALAGEVDGDRGADALGAAGDQSAFVGEVHGGLEWWRAARPRRCLFADAERLKDTVQEVVGVDGADDFSELGEGRRGFRRRPARRRCG